MEVIHIIDDYSIIQEEDLKYFKITKEHFQLVLNKLIEIVKSK